MITNLSRRRETHRSNLETALIPVQGLSSFNVLCALSLFLLGGLSAPLQAQSPGVAERPYLGWSSFSEQTVSNSFLTQTNIQAQSDALQSSGLQAHGFSYINIDNGWQGSFDSNGRPTPNTSLF